MDNQNIAQFQSQKLKSPWTLIKEAWHIYKAKFKLFVVLSVPSIVLTVVSLTTSVLPPVVAALAAILLGLGAWVVNLWLGMSFLYGVVDQNPSVSAKEILRKGWRRIFSYLWVTILFIVILMGGYFLLIIPGIMLSIWFSFAMYALATEDARGLDALLRSKQLVKGLWWQVVWRHVFFGLVIGVPILVMFAALVFLPVVITYSGQNGLFIEQYQEWMNTLQTILMPLWWIGGAFGMAFAYALFEDLKRVKGNPSYADYKESKGKYIALGILGIVGVAIVNIAVIGTFVLTRLLGGGDY